MASSIKPKVEALEALKADPAGPQRVFEMLTDQGRRFTLKGVARELKVQSGAFADWFMAHHGDLYQRAQKVRAEALAADALEIADREGDAKTKVETRKWLASRYDRETYGDERQVTVGIGADFAKVLQQISEQNQLEMKRAQAIEARVMEKVVEELPAPQLPESASSGAAPSAVSTAVPDPE